MCSLILSFVLAFAPMPNVGFADVEARAERYLAGCAALGWSGTALIVHRGKVVLERGYGLADREGGVPCDADTLYEIASTTKSITACAVLALAEDGLIELDESIAVYLPGVPEDKRAITVRQLLNHTSGMPRSAAGGSGEDLAVAVAAFLSAPLARTPGGAHEYWNGGYALLAGIVERASEAGYLDTCRARVFARAGMDASGFAGDTAWPAARQALGYSDGAPVRRAAEHAYGVYDYRYRGMGGVVTTARDLWRFAVALEAHKVLAKETLAKAWAAGEGSYGLGFGVTQTKRGTRRIGHGGDVRGFHTQWQLFPDERAAVILLSNVDGIPLWQLAWNLEALLFDAPLPYAGAPEVALLKPKELAAHAGRFLRVEGEGALRVAANDFGLDVTPEGVDTTAMLAGDVLDAERRAELETATVNARALFDAVRLRVIPPIEAMLAERIPLSWPRRLVEEIWPEHLTRWGALQEIELLGARAVPGGVEVRYALEHEKGKPCLALVLRGGRLAIFDLNASTGADTRAFAPVGDGVFATYAWPAGPGSPAPTPRLQFVRKGRRVIAVEVVGMDGAAVRFERAP